MRTIYCDESGFTGNNLLQRDQPWFVMSAVGIDAARATGLVEQAKKDFKLQLPELKGSKLVGSARGRRAIAWLLQQVEADVKVHVSEKKYALAGKFFEYVFEPALSDGNAIFYANGVHLYVSNLLYMMFVTKGLSAEELFQNFETLMRGRDLAGLEKLFAHLKTPDAGPDPLKSILKFCWIQREHVLAELDGLKGESGAWILDLSVAALVTLLSAWGSSSPELEVHCDDSKPLRHSSTLFGTYVGREPTTLDLPWFGTAMTLPRLTKEVVFESSDRSPGIQVADVCASACAFALNHQNETESQAWLRSLLPRVAGAVHAQLDKTDLREPDARLACVILLELERRAEKGESLIAGMSDFIATARRNMWRSYAKNYA